ncbi:unnamed protein product [Darwinula stevensoni]|uniref:Uncharacterized protein n=1 Tax=Darwinula stevensoni TaxID=69355 RepID=A0A7R8XJC8_9CRUS|nr:unnamed protein product [Darwinula stevensoni]CAG0892078.1 unnamed protein product [Darwinula stevensoni]
MTGCTDILTTTEFGLWCCTIDAMATLRVYFFPPLLAQEICCIQVTKYACENEVCFSVLEERFEVDVRSRFEGSIRTREQCLQIDWQMVYVCLKNPKWNTGSASLYWPKCPQQLESVSLHSKRAVFQIKHRLGVIDLRYDHELIKREVIGDELPGTALVQKIGPMGMPPMVVGEDIHKATSDYKSLKVHVRLAIKDRKATVEVVPSTSTLILKALRESPRDRKKVKNAVHHGSITMTDVVDIARKKLSPDFVDTRASAED